MVEVCPDSGGKPQPRPAGERLRATGAAWVRRRDVSKATRVSYGVANPTHRNRSGEPEPLEPGRRHQIDVGLKGMAQAFPPGHRLRLSISTSYWPLAWPPPQPVRLTLHPAGSSLVLPIPPPGAEDEPPAPSFGPPEGAPPLSETIEQPGEQRWAVTRDLAHDASMLEVVKDLGVIHLDDIDLSVTRRSEERYGFIADDFTSVRGETRWTMRFAREDWLATTVTTTVLTSTASDFHLHAQLDAYEGERRVAAKSWTSTIPRDHV